MENRIKLFIKENININTTSNTFTNRPKEEWIVKMFTRYLEEYKPANATSVEILKKWEEIIKGKI
jgi:hypothetical protein